MNEQVQNTIAAHVEAGDTDPFAGSATDPLAAWTAGPSVAGDPVEAANDFPGDTDPKPGVAKAPVTAFASDASDASVLRPVVEATDVEAGDTNTELGTASDARFAWTSRFAGMSVGLGD